MRTKRLLCLLLLLTLAACTNAPAVPALPAAGGATATGGPTGAADLLPTPAMTPQPPAKATPAATEMAERAPASPIAARNITPHPLSSAGGLVTPTPSSMPSRTTPGGKLTVLAQGLASPDDLALAPDGSVYLTDASDGSLVRYVSGQAPTVIVAGLSIPEGIVVLPGGDLIIAEQGKDRLVRYNPASRQITRFLALRNNTASAGVDGLALDNHNPADPSLLVPDSPNGTLLRVSLDGSSVRQIASGFVRPVAAWVELDGSILVADEFGNALERVRPNGKVSRVARLPQPDDVIVDGDGNIYVNCLVDGAVHRIAAGTGTDSVVAKGLGEPQGIAFDAQGNLLVTDPGHHRLVRIRLR